MNKLGLTIPKYTWDELLEQAEPFSKGAPPVPHAASLGGKAKAKLKLPAWNKGLTVPRSKASIEKQRQTITGKKRGPYKNYNHTAAGSKPVIFRGKEYPSMNAARDDTGASFYTIKKHLTQPPQTQ